MESLRHRAGVWLTLGGALLVVVAMDAKADLLSLCTGPKPTDPGLAAAYTKNCPAYLQSQFDSAIAAAQAQGATTALSQQQTQAAITTAQINQQQTQVAMLTALAGLTKAGAPPIPSGQSFDLSGIASAAQLRDVQLTYQVAKAIGAKMKTELGETKKAWLAPSADLAPYTMAPVESATVGDAVDNYSSALKEVKCAGQKSGQAAFDVGLLSGILGLQALLSTAGNIASMFQPNLLAATKLTAQDTQAITAGFLDGLDKHKQFVVVRPPALKATNKILVAYGNLRIEIDRTAARISTCDKTKDDYKAAAASIQAAKDYIGALTKSDGAKPSLLDVAARRAQLEDDGIAYTLVLTKEETSAGVSAIKPNIFSSVRLLMGSSVAISYQMVKWSGEPQVSGMESGSWQDKRGIDEWAAPPSASTGDNKAGNP